MKAFHPIPLIPGWMSRRCSHQWSTLDDGIETTHSCASMPDHRGQHRCACGERRVRIKADAA